MPRLAIAAGAGAVVGVLAGLVGLPAVAAGAVAGVLVGVLDQKA